MKQGWQIKKLSEICEIYAGQGAPQGDENYCTQGTPFIKAGNLEALTSGESESNIQQVSEDVAKSHKLVKYKKGSVVFAKSGMSCMKGYIYTLQGDCYVVSHLAILTPKQIESSFLNYCLQVYKPCSLAKEAAFPSITLKELSLFEIPVPSFSEQQRIVALLDAEFAKIDVLKANAEKNLQNAKDLFQAALKKELEPKEGWIVKTLKEIGLTQTGTTPKTSVKENYGNYIPFIKPADVNIDGLGNLNYDNEGLSEQGAKCGRVFEANSILMVCIGATIGKVGYAKQKVSSNQQINVLTPNDGYDFKFLYYCMASPRFQFEVIKEGESAKATLPIINKSKWESLSIAFPSKFTQQSIVARLDALNEKCKTLQANYEKTLSLCDDLKQALLRKAFNGEI
jgi:type I restriction enzyme S subunit